MKMRVWVGFAGLCLLAGSAWSFDEMASGLTSGLLRMAVHGVVLAVVFGVASLRWGDCRARDWSLWGRLAVGAAAMIGGPAVVSVGAGGHLSELNEVLVFMLVPVAVVLVWAQGATGFGAEENPLRRMAPALAGLAGGGLLLPFGWPGSTVGQVWLIGLIVAVVVAGVAAVRMHRLLAGVGVLRGASLVCAATSVVAAAFCRVGWTGVAAWSGHGFAMEVVRCLAIEAPVLLLTVWLLREMEPVGFAARFLLVPLVTIVESYLVMRPAASWTTVAGVALMAGGGAGLLAKDSNEMLGRDA